jgi:hypothetical protein
VNRREFLAGLLGFGLGGFPVASVEDRLKKLESQMSKAMVVTSALQGQPSNATLSIAHNDSWLFEDNVDATHPANLRYVIAGTTQRIVSARLSIHLAAYRTYATTTQATAHSHALESGTGAISQTAGFDASGNLTSPAVPNVVSVGVEYVGGGVVSGQPPGAVLRAGHTHGQNLGVQQGATATGVAIAFDGVDHTADLGGPFNADVIELDVSRFLITTKGAWHVIAMQPSGLGRIEAHLRLGMYVSAGQVA